MLDIRIRFRHLRSFLTIAQLKSVGRAAETLAVTQPALSKTLRELEQALGVRLFERGPKGMELTRYGHMFLQRAAASLTSLQQGVDEVRAAQGGGIVDLAIGVMPNMAPRVMPLAVRRFRETVPAASVHILGGGNTRLLEQLRLGEIDMVVGRLAQPERMIDLDFETLYSECLTLVVRRDHPLAAQKRVTAKMLGAWPLILPDVETIIGHEVNRYLIGHGVVPQAGHVETIVMDFGRGYVRATDAVWFVPRGVVEMDIEDGMLAEIALDRSELEGPVGITTRPGAPPRSAAAMMIEAVRQVCREMNRATGG